MNVKCCTCSSSKKKKKKKLNPSQLMWSRRGLVALRRDSYSLFFYPSTGLDWTAHSLHSHHLRHGETLSLSAVSPITALQQSPEFPFIFLLHAGFLFFSTCHSLPHYIIPRISRLASRIRCFLLLLPLEAI